MAASPYGRGVVGLLKQGWHEIPSVMASSVVGLVGLGMGGYLYYVHKTRGLPPNKYKRQYMVVRPDDPLVNMPVNKYPDY